MSAGGLMGLVSYGAADRYLTAAPSLRERSANTALRRAIEAMKKLCRKFAAPAAHAGLSRIQAIKRHRVRWEVVMEQILEVGLRPPDETIPVLAQGGAIYREVAAEFEIRRQQHDFL